MISKNILHFAALVVPCSILLVGLETTAQKTFSNPILDFNSADPSAFRIGEYYYLTISMNTETELTIFKSPTLTDFRNATRHVAYRATPEFADVWASEMHMVNGDLYIYFCMNTGEQYQRMYAIKAEDPSNPMGNWSEPIRWIQYN